jgi:hypothetical protein
MSTAGDAIRYRSHLQWAIGFLFGAMLISVGEIASGLVPDSQLHLTPHDVARILLFCANGASIGMFVGIDRMQYDGPRLMLWASLVTSAVATVAYLLAVGPVAGLAPSLTALVAVALITMALRREAQER